MNKIFFGFASLALILDQLTKQLFLNDFRWDSECISLTFVLNKGVAFSMFEFLGEYLKFIQLALLTIVVIYFYTSQEMKIYTKPIGLLVGAGFSNLLDRFIHGGVVDYIYWHCFFNFAIFNLADVLINISVALIFYIHFRKK